ncbi:hypothetical protein CJI59_19405 [Streptomyces sp. Alain-F2R5]|uniref:hypothetical protein n=1 Tax=Streptomyces mutabilis TaxID=67332 RepID=UPI000BCC4655|nr:hypothetical protein [Streptomyces sp. Alain-F2R5]PAN00045.1 hypothetical protein CJI59_19405 [Streptomyces sp. Alain-F2R5]
MRTLFAITHTIAFVCVFFGARPLLTALAQFLLVGFQRCRGFCRRSALGRRHRGIAVTEPR